MIVQFHQSDYQEALRLCDETYKTIDFTSCFPWHPCQQIESLDKDCLKFVFKEKVFKGYVAAYRLDETHFRLNLIVSLQHTNQGIGSSLFHKIETEVKNLKGKYLQARLLESERSLRFTFSKGFQKIHKMLGMSLKSGDFEDTKWKHLKEKFLVMGFGITTMKEEFDENNDPINKLAKLMCYAREGWLSPDPTQKSGMTTARQLRNLFTRIEKPEQFFIIKRDDEYFGYTGEVGTAVHPRYRNIGLAKYMKAHFLKTCIDAGQSHFSTCGANPAMQKVNEQLGYKFNGISEVRFVKIL